MQRSVRFRILGESSVNVPCPTCPARQLRSRRRFCVDRTDNGDLIGAASEKTYAEGFQGNASRPSTFWSLDGYASSARGRASRYLNSMESVRLLLVWQQKAVCCSANRSLSLRAE